jgi:hypothetical protein
MPLESPTPPHPSPPPASGSCSETQKFALSARLRGEREGTRRISDGEGEVGAAAAFKLLPHLPPDGRPCGPFRGPTLSALGGGEGEMSMPLRLEDR